MKGLERKTDANKDKNLTKELSSLQSFTSSTTNAAIETAEVKAASNVAKEAASGIATSEWFKVHAANWEETPVGILVKIRVGVKDTDYLVFGSEQFKARVKDDFKKVRKVHLVYYTTSKGRMGIWPFQFL